MSQGPIQKTAESPWHLLGGGQRRYSGLRRGGSAGEWTWLDAWGHRDTETRCSLPPSPLPVGAGSTHLLSCFIAGGFTAVSPYFFCFYFLFCKISDFHGPITQLQYLSTHGQSLNFLIMHPTDKNIWTWTNPNSYLLIIYIYDCHFRSNVLLAKLASLFDNK